MKLINYFETNLRRNHLNDKELNLLMGYGDDSPSEDIQEIVCKMFEFLQTVCKPRCGYKILRGTRNSKDTVNIESKTLNTGAIIATAMREAEYIAVFTATLGNEFDDWLHSLKAEDNILYEYIANSLGSVLVEGLVDELMDILSTEIKKEGLKVSNNYSPGYCSWALTEQRKLFSLLPEGISGINLTDSCLMLPIKSVSGIAAIGRDVKKRPYKCEICRMKNCLKNKTSF